MQANIFTYNSCGVKGWFILLNIVKNILYIAAVFLSFSLWFASTVNTPKTLENLQARLDGLSASNSRLEAKVEFSLEELRLIKTILNNKQYGDKNVKQNFKYTY